MTDDETPTLLNAYLAQRPALTRFLKARLGNEAEAGDIAQEIYIRLTRAPPGGVDNPSAYLYRMAANLARDHRRERQRAHARDGQWLETRHPDGVIEPVADEAPADRAYAAKQELTRLIASLDDLSPQCRRVFVLHKFEGLSHPEIAARVGISRSTVEKHMGTALRHLLKQRGSL